MNSTQSNVLNQKFEANEKTSESTLKTNVQTEDTANKRYDHHLIDQDLELEDKNGHRLNPKAQNTQTV